MEWALLVKTFNMSKDVSPGLSPGLIRVMMNPLIF